MKEISFPMIVDLGNDEKKLEWILFALNLKFWVKLWIFFWFKISIKISIEMKLLLRLPWVLNAYLVFFCLSHHFLKESFLCRSSKKLFLFNVLFFPCRCLLSADFTRLSMISKTWDFNSFLWKQKLALLLPKFA